MDSLSLLPYMDVRMQWASRHSWQAGSALFMTTTWISSFTLWLVESGSVHVRTSAATFEARAGDALILPGDVERTIDAPESVCWLSVGLMVRLGADADAPPPLPSPLHWQPEPADFEALQACMEQAVPLWVSHETQASSPNVRFLSDPPPSLPRRTERDAFTPVIGGGLGKTLLGMCWRSAAKGATTAHPALNPFPDWLLRALQYSETHWSEAHPQTLAVAASVSPALLRRGFARYLGLSPQEYLTRRRLREAAKLLETTTLTVAVVADKIGFASPFHFTRLFTRRYNISPARYRAQARQPSV